MDEVGPVNSVLVECDQPVPGPGQVGFLYREQNDYVIERSRERLLIGSYIEEGRLAELLVEEGLGQADEEAHLACCLVVDGHQVEAEPHGELEVIGG